MKADAWLSRKSAILSLSLSLFRHTCVPHHKGCQSRARWIIPYGAHLMHTPRPRRFTKVCIVRAYRICISLAKSQVQGIRDKGTFFARLAKVVPNTTFCSSDMCCILCCISVTLGQLLVVRPNTLQSTHLYLLPYVLQYIVKERKREKKRRSPSLSQKDRTYTVEQGPSGRCLLRPFTFALPSFLFSPPFFCPFSLFLFLSLSS